MIFCEFGHVAAFHTYMRHKFGILQLDGMICTLDYKEIMMKVKDTTKASKSVTKVKVNCKFLMCLIVVSVKLSNFRVSSIFVRYENDLKYKCIVTVGQTHF